MTNIMQGIRAMQTKPEFKNKPAFKEEKKYTFDHEIVAVLEKNKRLHKKNRLSQLTVSRMFGTSEFYVYKIAKKMRENLELNREGLEHEV
jgi:hypothetical protein